MNRLEWQQLAEDRLLDAKALLDAGRWSGAYYLAGYATEYALKSCVLAHVERTGIIFQDREFSKNALLGRNRQTAKDWKETSRYEQWTRAEAERMYNAVAGNQDGVLQWIRSYW